MTVLSRQVQQLHTQTHDTHKRPHCGRAVHDTPQNYVTSVLRMRWIESFICQMRRGRQGGERCQSLCVPVCIKEKRKYSVQQWFSDTEVNFLSVMEGKELWRMSSLVSCLCMTCLEPIRSDMSADRFFSAGKHCLYKFSISASFWRRLDYGLDQRSWSVRGLQNVSRGLAGYDPIKIIYLTGHWP